MTLPAAPRARSRLHSRERVAVAPILALLAACVQPPYASESALASARWAAADSAFAGGCHAPSGSARTLSQGGPPEDPGATFEAAWSMINERHFDTTFNGVDWAGIRAELLPRARQARSTEELRGLIRDMLGRLGQSHFAPAGSGSPTSR